MTNELQIFNNPKFGQIRSVEKDGKVLFVASDVAKALGYEKPNNAINQHCRYTLKHSIPHPQNPEKEIEVNVIPEGDIYRLAAKSELPGADEFERWIFDEILPSIRKHGAYMTPETIEKTLTNPDFIIDLATRLKEEQQKRIEAEKTIEHQKPKVLFADSVSASTNSILVADLAKILKQNGIEVGEIRLWQWLRDNGYVIKEKGKSYNMPTQRSMELKVMEVIERTINPPNKEPIVSKTTLITGKGQIYFINKFKSA